jgi:hypothetical protein
LFHLRGGKPRTGFHLQNHHRQDLDPTQDGESMVSGLDS